MKKQQEDQEDVKKSAGIQIPKSTQKLLYYLGGLILVVLVYFLVFQNFKAISEELKVTVADLKAEELQLIEMKEHQEENQAAIAKMTREIKDMLKGFPANVMEEDGIWHASRLEEGIEVLINEMEFSQRNLVAAGTQSDYSLFVTPIIYRFSSVGYADMKEMISKMTTADVICNVESVKVAYDEDNGLLQGELICNHYSVEGGDQQYEPSDSMPVNVGNDNVFGTAK